MGSEALTTHIDDRGVGRLTLTRPEVHNAFDDGLIADLDAALASLDADEDVRVVVLQSEGKSFSAGADLNWMKRMAGYGHDENLADARALAAMLKRLNGMAKPVVAKVQGAALGGGVGLVAACDIAIASDRAAFALSEVRLGLIPATISPYVIAAIGERAARRWFLTGERFAAEEALRIGLVHEVVPHAVLDARVDVLVDELLKCGPASVAEAKALIGYVSAAVDLSAEAIDRTARHIADVRATDEGREGVSAFLEKRKPGWVR